MEGNQRLFVDMDGTLAVFTPVDELEALYQKGYFLNLKPQEKVVEAVRYIIKNHPEIGVYSLSAYLSDSQYALSEKNEWLDRNLPEIDEAHRIFCPCGSDKKEYVPGGIRESDHLLDDYNKNLNEWEPAGRGIKLLNPINHTRGSWQGDRIRYDRPPESLANGIVDIMQGKRRIFDNRVTGEEVMQESIERNSLQINDTTQIFHLDFAVSEDETSEYLIGILSNHYGKFELIYRIRDDAAGDPMSLVDIAEIPETGESPVTAETWREIELALTEYVNATREAERKNLVDYEIRNEVVSFYSGQMNAVLSATGPNGETVGYIQYAEYQDVPYIQYISTKEEYRRQGVATRLLQELQSLYEGKEIDWGMTTEDGTKLREAVTYVVEDAEVKDLMERLAVAQAALQENEKVLNELYQIEIPTQDQDIEIERLGDRWEELTDEIRDLEKEIDGRSSEKRFVKKEEKQMEKEDEIFEDKIAIPPITVDPAVVFFEDERPEEFALYEAQRKAAESAWRKIILGEGHSFTAAEFTTPGDYGQTLILTKSVRDGVDYQLSFFDKNGEATMHEDYYIDNNVEPIDIRGNSRESLFARLANYSLRGREITATVNYEPKERENMAEKNIVQVQSAVRSNYDGYVALSQFDRNRPWNANDYKLYLGKRENYDNQGNYDNSDNSLVFISNNRKMDSFLYGEGWVQSQQAMIDNGSFTAADYAEYAQLKEGVLKQFEGQQLREVKFEIDMDMREQGEISGTAFRYPDWDGQYMSYAERLEAVYWRDRANDGRESVVTSYHREGAEIRLADGMTAADVERRYAKIKEEYGGDEIPRLTEQDRTFLADLARYNLVYRDMVSPILDAYSELTDAVYPSAKDLHGDIFTRLHPAAWGLEAAEGAEPYRLVVLTSERFGDRNAPHNISYNQPMDFEDIQDYQENPNSFLESVYARLGNAGMQPSNYYGHSPSVGDTIVILTPDGAEAHYVASFGFEREEDANRVITPEQLRAARLGMTVREEYDLLVNLNEAARAAGDENLINTVEEQTVERLDFLYGEYKPVFELAAIREVITQEQDKLQILDGWEPDAVGVNPIALYADGLYSVNPEEIRKAMSGNQRITVGSYNRDYRILAGERLQTEINHRFERAADAISQEYPVFYRLHAAPRPLGDQGQYDFFVQQYERSTTDLGVIPKDIVYVGDSKNAIEVTNHLNAGSEYGEYLEENFGLRRQLGLGALMGDVNKWDVSHQSEELTELRDWRVDRVTRAMEAAGYSLDPIESSAERGVFNGEYGARMDFNTVHEAEEWLDGVVFDDPEVSDAVEKIMHPERFALDGMTYEDMIQLVFEYETMLNIPATNDFIPEIDRMTTWDAEQGKAAQKPFYGANMISVTQAVVETRCREILAQESRENIHLAYNAILEARNERMGLEIGGLAGRLQEQAAKDMNRQDSPWGSWFARISHPDRPQDYIELDITGYSTRNSVIESATLILNGNVHEQMEMDEMSFDNYGNEEGFDTGFAANVAALAQRFDPSITDGYILYAPAGWSEHSLNEHYQMLRDRSIDNVPNWDAYNARAMEQAENTNERSDNVAEQNRIRVAIESTDDYTDTGFHQRLVDDDIQNEDGSYGKVVDYYRIVAIGENGRLAAFDDRVFTSADEARAAVAELPGLELRSYDDMVNEAWETMTAIAQERRAEPQLTVLFRDEQNDIEAGINADGDLYLSGSRSGYNLPDTIENRRAIERDIERYTGQQVDLVGDMQEPELEEDYGNLTFYVAESMEFENLGEYHEGLTLKEAFEIYDSIPSERLNGGKGIGFTLHDGSMYSGNFALLLGNEVQDYVINEIDHFRNNPLVQQAIQDCKAEFDRRSERAQGQEQPISSFIAHYYVVEDIQARGPLSVQNYSDLNDALAAYAALPSDKMKALGIQNTNDLPGSLDIVQCKDGIDTLTNDWEKVAGWDNPEVQAAVEQITKGLEENIAIERRVQEEERSEEPLVDIYDLAYDDEGYLHFTVEADGYQLNGLYRVLDPANGEDMELVSIDYGDRHPIIERQWSRIEDALYDEAYDRYNEMVDQRFEHKDRLVQAMALAGYIYNEQASTPGHHVFDAGQGGITFVNLDAAYRWFDGYMMLADHPLEAQMERILNPEQYESPIPEGDEWFYNDPDRGDVIAVHYNPDSNAGGQFVLQYLSYDLIGEALKTTSNNEERFFEVLNDQATVELVDIDTLSFKELAAHYRNTAPDFTHGFVYGDGSAMAKLVEVARNGLEQENQREVQQYLQELVARDVQNHGAVMPDTLERIERVGYAYNEETGIVEKAAEGKEEQIRIGEHPCRLVDEWSDGTNTYVLGNSIEDSNFYYAVVNGDSLNVYAEYDEKPSREKVEGDFADLEAARTIDQYEAEFGADGSRAFPNLNEDEVVYRLDDSQYLYIQESNDGFDYTIYDADMKELDGGQLDNLSLTMAQARTEILALHEMHPEKIEKISIEEYERIGYEAERRNKPLTYSENEALVKLAERLDNFTFDYDYYGYADDVGIDEESRSEHRAHLADALANNEFSPMIDHFREIIAEEGMANNRNSELFVQAQELLYDLTHLDEYQRTYAAAQQQTGEVGDPMVALAARLDSFAFDANREEWSASWNREVDALAEDLRAGNVEGVSQWLNSAERYLIATNDEERNAVLIREVRDLSYTLEHLDQYQQFFNPAREANAVHPIKEFVYNGRTLEGASIPLVTSQIPHFADRTALFHAVQEFEEANNLPANQREIHNGTYEDKDFLYMGYDRHVGMSHRNDLSIQPYMERLTAMAEDKNKFISLLPLVAEVYYAQRNGLTHEQIDMILTDAEIRRSPLDSIRNLRHACENGMTQEQIAVLVGEDSFAQENLMGYMLEGGSIENAMALKGCDVAQYYILSGHLNNGTLSTDMVKAIIEAGVTVKDWNNKDLESQRASNPDSVKWRFSTFDYEFFTEYLADVAVNDKSITPEMVKDAMAKFVEQRETNNLKKFIAENGGIQAFGTHREESERRDAEITAAQTSPEEEKEIQEGVELSAEKKDTKEQLTEQLQQGVQNVLNSENFKNWLDTSSKMFLNNYSFNNAILVWCQKPDATHTMGYEQWKEYGRNVAKGAEGIKIFVPVIAYEKKDGDLWRMIKGKLQAQMKADPSLPLASFRLGMSKLEITMNQNGLYGLRIDGKERGLKSEKDMQNFIKHNVLGKVPMYFTVGTVFDAKDTIVPEYLWMKKGFTKAEMVKDESGNPIKNRRGEYKIINTPERQAKFQPSLDMKVPEIKPENAAILYDALKAVSERNGIHVYEKTRAEDDTLKGGADGYFSRNFTDENPKGYIVMPTDLEPTKAVSVMLHEMSHSELHGDLTKLAQEMGEEKIPSAMREVQAEAVAYVVGKNFGIESSVSSFNYLAAYTKGFELQALSKSIEVIYKECKQLTTELKAELESRGLNMDLSERDKDTAMDKEAVQSLVKTYVAYTLEQGDRVADIEKELPTLAEQNRGKDAAVAVLVAQASNVQRQKEDLALIQEKAGALECAETFAEQKECIVQIEAAKSRVENYKKDFGDLSAQFQDLAKTERTLKDRFVADPVATIKDMGTNMDYVKLGSLTNAQIQYLAKSEYVARELAPLLRNDPAQFEDKAYERASQIDKVASKNGMFVEVIFCEQWTDKPIVEGGALMHPKVADTIVKQAEAQIRGLRAEAENVGDYFPYNKCDLMIYQAEKGEITKAYKTRVDIGDGAQSSLVSHLKDLNSANKSGIASAFEKATREKGAKEKILFNGDKHQPEKVAVQEKMPSERGMTHDAWKREIRAERTEQGKSNDKDSQQEKSEKKKSSYNLGKE